MWAAAYFLLVVAPLAVASVVALEAPRPGRLEAFAVALGFLAFTQSVLQFALVSRVGPTSRDVGGDRLLALHRGIAAIVIGFVAVHIWLLVPEAPWRSLSPVSGPPAWRPGALAAWALAAIVLSSLLRRQLRLSYEAWQWMHLGGALVLTLGAAAHILQVRLYAGAPIMRGVVVAYVTLFAALTVRHRIIRPLRLRKHPWRVQSNVDAGGSTRKLRLQPVGHRGLQYEGGQFVWILTGRSPFWSAQHPISIASAPVEGGAIELLIKALGDWSGGIVPALEAGARVSVDGPFGDFVPSGPAGSRLVLIAGGIGIAPMRGILQATRDRRDSRPVTLILAAADASRIPLVDEITSWPRDMNLTVVPVFENPPETWQGERGYVTAELLRRHVAAPLSGCEYLISGPIPMIDAVTAALATLGVPGSRIHTERFQMV